MKKLLSLPPGLVESFHDVSGLSRDEYFVSCDPVGSKLGSGGGTVYLLEQACRAECGVWSVECGVLSEECGVLSEVLKNSKTQKLSEACLSADRAEKLKNSKTQKLKDSFPDWLAREHRIIIHAGGQSRRLPAYAPLGKVLTPIPVFRWARGQRIDQTLLSLQLPLYERISEMAGERQHTLVCSGDVMIETSRPVPRFDTEADVVCFAIGVEAEVAQNHGVFLCHRNKPTQLDFMLQKPTPKQLGELSTSHFYLIDIGAWLLSDRAVQLLAKKYKEHGCYDLYSEFGCALGANPSQADDELADLSVAIVPLDKGRFYHFGTTRELIGSTLQLQNRVTDGRDILHIGTKAHPSIFTQNCSVAIPFTAENEYTWVENARLGEKFTLTNHNVVTGVPTTSIEAHLEPGQCLDIVPIGEKGYVVRPYGFNDKMAGDIQFAPIYGIAEDESELQKVVDWALKGEGEAPQRMLSADGISNQANLQRQAAQRRELMAESLTRLKNNHERSVFYQLDLHHAAQVMKEQGTAPLCGVRSEEKLPFAKRISEAMWRYEMGDERANGEAFEAMREYLTHDVIEDAPTPRLSVAADQIVWSRSPVRIDLAGGWTDTPPYCILNGGDVVNMAIELNSQPPLQVYVKPSEQLAITIRSIDMGVSETITRCEQLTAYAKVGNAFSIPKAALVLAGFGRRELRDELSLFGGGIELTLLSAIPSGSGLGTSSILASAVLAAISDFAGLGWDKNEICHRTLILEQMLTTNGGWQDQYGGVLHGIKRLTTTSGICQTPEVRWLPDSIFTSNDTRQLHLLYYTGMRRTAKTILDEIVRGMFLQRSAHFSILAQMGENVTMMYDALLRGNADDYAACLRRTWQLNKRLDSGTNPPNVEQIIAQVDDLCQGYKLPGAGGGGYLYMMAKDHEAASRIRQRLEQNKPNAMARFVEMSVSQSGLQVTRS